MTLKPYPKYKESGVAWLREVPEGWDVALLKRFMTVKSGDMISSNLETESGYPIIGGNGIRGYTAEYNTPANTIVIGRVGALCGCVHHVEVDFWASEHAFRVIEKKKLSKRFLYHLISSLSLNKHAIKTAQPLLNTEIIETQWVAVPDLILQDLIAIFLDRETAKIDELIADQEKLIALLAEKRQATISHAVTKGLNPAAPMKDSGIEWLGQIPAHWMTQRLKYLVKIKKNIAGKDGYEILSITQKGVAIKDISGNDGQISMDYAKYQIVETGDFAMNHMDLLTGYIDISKYNGVTSPDYRVFSISDTDVILPTYLLRILQNGYRQKILYAFGQGASQLGRWRLPTDQFNDFGIPLPPLHEQKEILAFIDSELDKLDNLNTEANRAIDLLKERRTALISAAVTGKIDVREMAKVIPFPIDRRRVRGLVATEIIENLSTRPTFGRVMLQKAAYLAETYADIAELGGNYLREAAGPLDRNMIDEMEAEAGNLAGVNISQIGGVGTAVKYRTTGLIGKHKNELKEVLGQDRAAKLRRIINIFIKLDTATAEAYATIFAVWNDFLIDGLTPSDDEIINGVLNDWHPEKGIKFKFNDLKMHLGKMRELSLIPTGLGPKTETGRFFP